MNNLLLGTVQPPDKGFEANRARKFTRTFGKISVTQFLCRTFSVPNLILLLRQQFAMRLHHHHFSAKLHHICGNPQAALLLLQWMYNAMMSSESLPFTWSDSIASLVWEGVTSPSYHPR